MSSFLVRSVPVVGLTFFGLCLYSSEVSKSNCQTVGFDVPIAGLYRIHGHPPRGFETYYEFEWELLPADDTEALKVDKDGNLPVRGALFIKPAEFRTATMTEERGEIGNSGDVTSVKVVRLNFSSAKLQPEKNLFFRISFVTEKVDGTSYSFEGKFLTEPTFDNGSFVELVGKLRKFKDMRQEAEATLKFLRWAYE